MNFWTQEKIKEALPNAKLINFHPDWTGKGLVIWHDNIDDNVITLIRRQGETRGIIPKLIPQYLNQISAIMTTNAEEFTQYNKPIIEIKGNTSNAIISMARYIRTHYKGKVAAVTGSAGKTTTTRLLYNLLSSKYETSANLNKFNTTWGLSWNMTCFDIRAKYWVIETSLGGGMSRNSAITKPHYAIITNIAPVHLKEGMTIKDVAEEKSKIFNSMQQGSTAILWKESECFDILYNAAKYKGLKIITFGESINCDIQVISAAQNYFIVNGQICSLGAKVFAKHVLLDMAATLAVALNEGMSIAECMTVLKEFTPIEGRGALTDIKLSENQSIHLIDEAYNANPLSMKAAIESFYKLYADKNKVLILGDMAECGDQSYVYHQNIATTIRTGKPQKIILCGKEIKVLYDEIKDEYDTIYFENVAQLNSNIISLLKDKDYVLIKSSNSSGLHKTTELLTKAGL